MTNKEIIELTENELLKENWYIRYAKYADDILKHWKQYEEMSHKARVAFPLSAYTSISKMTQSGFDYDIRYIGQSIGTLSIKSDCKRYFNCSKGYIDLQKKRGLEKLPKLGVDQDWDSKEMIECRSILCSNNIYDAEIHSPEHKCENLLLREFSKSESKQKSLLYIQPVKFGGKFVQLTTPLMASRENEVSYSRKGGGIDILARVGLGRSSHLSVIELKDENYGSEPVEVVLQQALSYAVFLAKLLDEESTKIWWSVLGYKKEPNHIIDVVSLMPKGEEHNIEEDYPVGSFTLRLRTLYFDKEALFNQEKFEFSGSYIKELNGNKDSSC